MATYKPRRAGFKEIVNGSEIAAALEEIVGQAKTIAVGLAQEFRVTGEYADSFETKVGVEPVSKGPARLVGRLTNTAPYAAAVEYGYAGSSTEPGHKPHHVLKRTLEALGGE